MVEADGQDTTDSNVAACAGCRRERVGGFE
jgi:hypothetical protein